MKDMKLFYYKDDKQLDEKKGVINFDLVNCSLTFKNKKFRF